MFVYFNALLCANRGPCEAELTVAAGLLGGLVTLSVRLSVGVLLSVLQAELVAHIEGLTHCAHNAHGLRLSGRVREADGRVWDGKVTHLFGINTRQQASSATASYFSDEILCCDLRTD